MALKELQDFAKARAHQHVELRLGYLVPRRSRGVSEDDPDEWRLWNMMYARERKHAFELLQVFSSILVMVNMLTLFQKEHKDCERAKVQKQISEIPTEQILDPEAVAESKEVKPAMVQVDETIGTGTVEQDGESNSHESASQDQAPTLSVVEEQEPNSQLEAITAEPPYKEPVGTVKN